MQEFPFLIGSFSETCVLAIQLNELDQIFSVLKLGKKSVILYCLKRMSLQTWKLMLASMI